MKKLYNVTNSKQQLDKAGYPAWVNEYSNTVFLQCPSPELAHKYQLAQNEDARFGGKLAHVVVMQHFTEETIDAFVAALGFAALHCKELCNSTTI